MKCPKASRGASDISNALLICLFVCIDRCARVERCAFSVQQIRPIIAIMLSAKISSSSYFCKSQQLFVHLVAKLLSPDRSARVPRYLVLAAGSTENLRGGTAAGSTRLWGTWLMDPQMALIHRRVLGNGPQNASGKWLQDPETAFGNTAAGSTENHGKRGRTTAS